MTDVKEDLTDAVAVAMLELNHRFPDASFVIIALLEDPTEEPDETGAHMHDVAIFTDLESEVVPHVLSDVMELYTTEAPSGVNVRRLNQRMN